MNTYDCEVEKYVVYCEKGLKIEFSDAESAIEFGRKKMNDGIDVDIKQINFLVGWY